MDVCIGSSIAYTYDDEVGSRRKPDENVVCDEDDFDHESDDEAFSFEDVLEEVMQNLRDGLIAHVEERGVMLCDHMTFDMVEKYVLMCLRDE
jgi:hypothetical protein